MKTAVCYYSRHHGNTRRVLEEMAQVGKMDLIEVTQSKTVDWEDYDCIGFASGIYAFDFHKSVADFARKYLPKNKSVFFVCTYGIFQGNGSKTLQAIAREKGCRILGTFCCKGYDTFGPFRLIGGIAKGRPDRSDLEKAQNFYTKILSMQ